MVGELSAAVARHLPEPCDKTHKSSMEPARDWKEALTRVRGSLSHMTMWDRGSVNADNLWCAVIHDFDSVEDSLHVWVGNAPDSEGGLEEAVMRAYNQWRNAEPGVLTEKGKTAVARHLASMCKCPAKLERHELYGETWECVNDLGFPDWVAHMKVKGAEVTP